MLPSKTPRSIFSVISALLVGAAIVAIPALAVAAPIQTANAAGTTTALVSSRPVANYGNGGAITATVKPVVRNAATPTGTVDFQVDGEWFWTASLDSRGKALLPLSEVYPSLMPGTYSITATYSGDATFDSSSSTTVSQTLVGISEPPVSTLNPGAGGKPVFTPSSFRMSFANPVGCNVNIANNTPSAITLLYGTPGAWKRLPGRSGTIPAGSVGGVGVGISNFTGYFTAIGAKNYVAIHCK